MSVGERGRLLTIVFQNGSAVSLSFFILLFIVTVFFSFSTTFVCSDDIVVNALVKFLDSVIPDGEMSGSTGC